VVLKAALTSAATEGHLAIVTALLDSGAEQEARDTALRVGHTAIVRLLLDYDA
jgi:ankyrin repeat protein